MIKDSQDNVIRVQDINTKDTFWCCMGCMFIVVVCIMLIILAIVIVASSHIGG